MEKQRFLVITVKQDVTRANDAQIDALKAFWLASLGHISGINVSFELKEVDPMARVRSMLRLVRSEYEVDDDEVPAESREHVTDEP